MEREAAHLASRLGALLAPLLCFVLAACGGPDDAARGVTLRAWAHRGKPAEWDALVRLVEEFNGRTADVRVELVEVSEDGYDTQVQTAAVSDELPDVLELDGPMLASYAWRGWLEPLGDRLPAGVRADLLPSIVEQGTWDGRLYAVGMFDSGLGLYGNRRLLEAVGARIPSGPGDAWTAEAFDELLGRLRAEELSRGGDGRVLDLKRDYRGEWWTYAFHPVLESAGGGLVAGEGAGRADGVLDSDESVAALERVQGWFTRGLVDPNTDGRAFMDGRVALSWSGHWDHPRYRDALGDELLLAPLPDFGRGARTGMGSWCWSLTRSCRDPEAAARFLAFLLQPESILAVTRANGAVPGRKEAVARSPLYASDGPLALFARQLRTVAVPRPRTPAYPVVTSAFQEAMLDVVTGADVRAELEDAAATIDRDIADHRGYPRDDG